MRHTSLFKASADGGIGPARFMLTIMLIVFLVEVLIMVAFQYLIIPGNALAAVLLDAIVLTLVAGVISWYAIGRPFRRALRRSIDDVHRSRDELLRAGRSRDLDATILRALDLAETEDEIVEVARRTLTATVPGRPGELLMADSSVAHLRLVAEYPAGGGPGCKVDTPMSCPAVRRGHPLSFASSTDLDACPRLRDRDGGATSGVCVPITLLGVTAGVLHVTGEPDSPPDPETIERLRMLGAGIGSRLGMVRTLSDSAVAASTDPLTGLLNRRSLEARVAPLERNARDYAVIALDLDFFKRLNDTHGHLTGDQALRVFSRVLCSTARDGDLVSRLGGEEFAIVLPATAAADAASLAERVRLELALAITDGGLPGFTVSAGVADSHEADTYEQVAALADRRLYQAKQLGRDRVESAALAVERS